MLVKLATDGGPIGGAQLYVKEINISIYLLTTAASYPEKKTLSWRTNDMLPNLQSGLIHSTTETNKNYMKT